MAYVIPWGTPAGAMPTAADGSPLVTPDMLQTQRQYGLNELQQGESAAPIQSWSQGAARLAQALMGGLAYRNANQQEMAYRAAGMKALTDALSGGGGAAPAAPGDVSGAAGVSPTPAPSVSPALVSALKARGGTDITPTALPVAPAAAPAAAGASTPSMAKLMSIMMNPYVPQGGQQLASSIIQYNLLPHPKTITYNPITGSAGTFEQTTGEYSPLPQASAGGGSGSYPPGFVFGGAKPYQDPSNGETGLIDVNGVKAVIGKPNPTTDQSAAANAAALATKANDLLKGTELGQTGAGSEIERGLMGIPVVGALVSGPEARKFEAGKAQFISAVRSLAISNRINPETIDFNEKALFAQRGDTPEEVQQKQSYRDQMIADLQKRAGPFAQPSPGGAPPTPVAGDALSQAKAAIAKGAPRDAVIQRLKQMGNGRSGI